ncbi:MAG: hypothetical protein LC122_13255 [Chitinophagales bacterium]|nr:hypothetical protein [Chitinophagales bacterium]
MNETFLLECPEINLISDLLKKDLVGKKILRIELYDYYSNNKPSGSDNFIHQNYLDNFIVKNVNSYGRLIYFDIENKLGQLHIISKLRFSGSWTRFKTKNVLMEIVLDDNTSIYFSDPSKLATVSFETKESLNKEINKGVDPLKVSVVDYFDKIHKKARNTTMTISRFLFSIKNFYGIGHYLRAETLYRSKIYPYKYTQTLTREQLFTICNNLRDIATESYNNGGAQNIKYSNDIELSGNYRTQFKVFEKRYNDDNKKIIWTVGKKDKNPIFWCPEVQEKNE